MTTWDAPTYKGLEAKRKGLVNEGEFGTFSSGLGLRPRRCTSWLERAEREMASGDYDAAFIFYWIAFDAAYTESRTGALMGEEEKPRRKAYFDEIIMLDRYDKVSNAIPNQCADPIMKIINNKYVFPPFWAYHNGDSEYENWPDILRSDLRKVYRTPLLRHTREYAQVTLGILFDRLYVLRNQLIHGGATWSGSMNREQVVAGARTIAPLVTLFTELMMDNPNTERAQRCLSWWTRAEDEMKEDDLDAAFIFYWIAFNAAYAWGRGEDDLTDHHPK